MHQLKFSNKKKLKKITDNLKLCLVFKKLNNLMHTSCGFGGTKSGIGEEYRDKNSVEKRNSPKSICGKKFSQVCLFPTIFP